MRYRQCVGVACAEGRGPVGLSREPTNAGPSIRRCLIQVTEVRPWSGTAMRGLSAAERHLRATSAHPPSRCARSSTPASSQASLGTRRRPSGEGAAPLWLLLLARTTCSAGEPKHLSMLRFVERLSWAWRPTRRRSTRWTGQRRQTLRGPCGDGKVLYRAGASTGLAAPVPMRGALLAS